MSHLPAPELLANQDPLPSAPSVKLTPPRVPDHRLSLASELPFAFKSSEKKFIAQYGPWLTPSGLSLNTQQLIRAVQNVAIHGLNPEAYGLQALLKSIDELVYWDTVTPEIPSSESNLSQAQRLRNHQVLRFQLKKQLKSTFYLIVTHLAQGVVTPRDVQSKYYRSVPTIDAQRLFQSVKAGKHSVTEVLEAVTQQHPHYRRLTQRMRNLLTEYAAGVQRPLVIPASDLAQKNQDISIKNIKRRLIETKELTASTVITNRWGRYEQQALMNFQRRYGLLETGTVDANTRRALNLSLREEMAHIALSLERWRWMPRNLGQRHIFINVPSLTLQVMENNKPQLSMKTVVGSEKHPTPVFSKAMRYIEFNPTWTVPAKITNKELIPRERRNTGYLAARKFEFLDNQGRRVPRSSIPDSAFDLTPFPYTLRQQSGPGNQLGRMKFILPNRFAVYLHDTQAKRHFSRADRALSHGCIRLSDPDALAKLLMQGDGYSALEITSMMRSRDQRRAHFKTPLPTHFTYITTWVDQNGQLQLRHDIYHRDSSLENALIASNTLLTAISTKTQSNEHGLPQRPWG